MPDLSPATRISIVMPRLFFGSTLTPIALAGCATPPAALPPPDAVAIRAALDKQVASFGPLLQNKDVAGTAALFTEDATWILPDAATFTGKAAIQAGVKGFFDALDSFTAETSAIDKLIVVNDSEAVTFSHGIGMEKLTSEKKAQRHNNPFVDYWKNGANGRWLIAYEVNADGVMPEKKP